MSMPRCWWRAEPASKRRGSPVAAFEREHGGIVVSGETGSASTRRAGDVNSVVLPHVFWLPAASPRMLPVVPISTVFPGSVERRFPIPALVGRAVAQPESNPGRRPPPKAARSGAEAGEHDGNLHQVGRTPIDRARSTCHVRR